MCDRHPVALPGYVSRAIEGAMLSRPKGGIGHFSRSCRGRESMLNNLPTWWACFRGPAGRGGYGGFSRGRESMAPTPEENAKVLDSK
jgi:hypothetical protein